MFLGSKAFHGSPFRMGHMTNLIFSMTPPSHLFRWLHSVFCQQQHFGPGSLPNPYAWSLSSHLLNCPSSSPPRPPPQTSIHSSRSNKKFILLPLPWPPYKEKFLHLMPFYSNRTVLCVRQCSYFHIYLSFSLNVGLINSFNLLSFCAWHLIDT